MYSMFWSMKCRVVMYTVCSFNVWCLTASQQCSSHFHFTLTVKSLEPKPVQGHFFFNRLHIHSSPWYNLKQQCELVSLWSWRSHTQIVTQHDLLQNKTYLVNLPNQLLALVSKLMAKAATKINNQSSLKQRNNNWECQIFKWKQPRNHVDTLDDT